ncbi:conserved Plasmodium protein, unknown function [Plasmodium berghei]|uniref:CCAAT-box DNA binding protein subunit B n=2 Tax=Plasmodium berghei TaxID=5821 RepID=A0A509AHG6_PLABA|nr:conserved protein, unknown function [Plasmodium berghei ANKA]CXI18560.1 conserved Plasmodium protein, unknown function [Plasmodium berghei]SCM19785.1 conserved Plasmodium protein, unknown function [Plasmodium berghei]SCN23526.1 conserved Plasmodium protein, unknown function [Plasmodium berghei]SCO59127.1 conserved Plasmodium protein, unknown function [Plasmodium berghei]SCO59848.1 conserved Plasmodium protein, unknown function [Plasmodium berghei]|eukprot:XP_034420640.1 conserved protein, unknown function [Plasmodium berghei ANKA]
MKILWGNTIAIVIFYFLKNTNAIQLYGNDLKFDESFKPKIASDKKKILEDNQFQESLKSFLKNNGNDDFLKKNANENENIFGSDKFIEDNKEFINKQILSDLYSNFIITVVNDNTLNFLDNIKSNNEENTEFQIEFEESCSPFFCEKVMKAKEIESKNKSNEREIVLHQNDNSNKEIIDNMNQSEQNNDIDNQNNEELFANLDSILDKTNPNGKGDVDAIYSREIDGNQDKQKIILTDGTNVYVLEEVVQDNNNFMDEQNINLRNGDQEIKMHIPQNNNKVENNDINEFFENKDILNNFNLYDNDNNGDGYVNSVYTDSERGINEHKMDYNENSENKNENISDSIDESILNMTEEELSQKIFDDIKMNNEDKIECHNYSNSQDKCNSFKKCTFVNIDNKDVCFLDYNYMLFLKNTNCTLQSKSSLLSISKDLLQNEIINRQMFQLLRNSSNNNFICDTITYSFLTSVVDNTNYDDIFS